MKGYYFVEKCCPVCGKYYIDKSANCIKVACSPQCRNEWFNSNHKIQHFERKISMRLKVLEGQGVGCTEEERELILAKLQAGKCEICGRRMPMEKLNIDHDHRTGKIRGILCDGCNMALGFAQDDPEIIKSLGFYLVNRHVISEIIISYKNR